MTDQLVHKFQIHAKYEHAGKHKRNLLITGGVTASVLVSPILAGLAVGESGKSLINSLSIH